MSSPVQETSLAFTAGMAFSVPIEVSLQAGATIDLPPSAVALLAFGTGDVVNLPSSEPGGGAVVLIGSHATILTGENGGGEHLYLLGDHDSVTGANSQAFASLGRSDTITAAGNNALISLSGQGGTNDTILLNGLNDSVVGSSFPGSDDNITATGAGASITVGGEAAGANNVALQGTGATVEFLANLEADRSFPFGDGNVTATGSGTATVAGGGAEFSFTGGTGQYSVSGGTAEISHISGGDGGGTFAGGYYEDSFITHPFYVGSNFIEAGALASTLTGAAHGTSVLVANGGASDHLVAGEYGNDTMSAGTSTGNNFYEGFNGFFAASNDPATPTLVINAGAGNDTLVSGLAAETLSGGGGQNLFQFDNESLAAIPAGGGNALITDFAQGLDKIDLIAFSETAQDVLSTATVVGGSTLLRLSNGQNIDVAHIGALSVHDFTSTR